MDDIAVLPNDVEKLKQIVSQLQGCLKTAEIELAYEQEKYKALVRQIFGTRSEKHTREEEKQLRLFNEAEYVCDRPKSNDTPLIPVKEHKKKKGGGRKPLPADLERKRIIHELPEEDRVCTCCGKQRPVIGEQTSEELETIPQHYLVHVHVRMKYGPCGCDEFQDLDTPPVVTAPMPKRLIPGSQFSSNCIAFFITAKFVDSIPFYRMEKVLARSGIVIPRITLCQNAISAAAACQPLIDTLWEQTLQCPVIQMDETTLQVLKERN